TGVQPCALPICTSACSTATPSSSPAGSVQVQEAGDDGTGPRVTLQNLDQRREPAGLDEGVAVEHADVPPDGVQRPLVGRRAEADVAVVEEEPGSLDAAEHVLDPEIGRAH